jgi:squalene-associated FAD-dependent desaturase
VIGAGLAGLSAALSLTAAGRPVVVHEAGPAAGGRCRSYFDRGLGLRIDNGNHLLLSGNRAAKAYIAEIGATERFNHSTEAIFPFLDLATGERWTLRPNLGRVPWWTVRSNRRVPGTRLSEYWAMARIMRVQDDTPVAESMRGGELYRRLLQPVAIAALNTPCHDGLARLLGAVMRETLFRGGKASLPMLPKQGLSEALIDPALAILRQRDAEIRFNSRIAGLTIEAGKVIALQAGGGPIVLGPDTAVVLAVPPWVAAGLLPKLAVPDAFEAILNIHFRHAADPAGPLGEAGFIGLISATAEWLFVKPGHVSVTISAANRMVDDPAETIARLVWPEVVNALRLPPSMRAEMPAYRVVKEKRATCAATAEQERRRPGARTELASNLAIAGDWTATGLPATIESAIRSGRFAAEVVLSF